MAFIFYRSRFKRRRARKNFVARFKLKRRKRIRARKRFLARRRRRRLRRLGYRM